MYYYLLYIKYCFSICYYRFYSPFLQSWLAAIKLMVSVSVSVSTTLLGLIAPKGLDTNGTLSPIYASSCRFVRMENGKCTRDTKNYIYESFKNI